ncbi:nicotinate phosphoribosyltransferase [Thauera aromatica]|uniref:nicotinate phosphoribosyltransferase n=1 Tax=Thauera aromatica TaxID=59405 RepID=UPI001FFCEDBC|nr:nicotinate phosphoribosyltransferase [Thauera aromatica]MCK2089310.1 nicotinate phosphoribosyltransferase [Thauera aromatica]
MNDSALVTDLYELTMLQAYFDEGMGERAVFELFVRALPRQRNFLVAAGLEQALDYLEQLRFTADELAWLRASGRFKPAFLDWLHGFRFSGDVDAMGEGTVFFADEPILRVEAPIGEAQFVESRLLNLLNFSTLIATKAARCVLAAPGKLLVDFGLRRAHGAEAGVLAARASYLAGFAGSATVLAGQRFGVPVFGTMAHAYIEAHQFETEAFTRFSASQPSRVTLLIDTYDTEAAAAKVVALAPTLKARGAQLVAVRIDSGDLAAHAHRVRAIFDAGGLAEVGIFASGNLDEHRIAALLAAGAPIDGFGIGTQLTTSADAPALDSAYKLQSYAGVPRRKRSEGKATWPGAKQVYRRFTADGSLLCDHVTLLGEPPPAGGVALLQPVLRGGARLAPPAALDALRGHAADNLARLPDALRRLEAAAAGESYPVHISPALQALAAEVDRRPH